MYLKKLYAGKLRTAVAVLKAKVAYVKVLFTFYSHSIIVVQLLYSTTQVLLSDSIQ